MKLSEQRTLLRLSPVTIALCEIFPAKLHMMWFNFMVLGLKVYCPSLFWGILTHCFVEFFFLCSVHNAKVQPVE